MNNAIFSPGTVICDLFQYVSVRSPATQALRQNGANAAATGFKLGKRVQSAIACQVAPSRELWRPHPP
jgi:hypothetical protein